MLKPPAIRARCRTSRCFPQCCQQFLLRELLLLVSIQSKAFHLGRDLMHFSSPRVFRLQSLPRSLISRSHTFNLCECAECTTHFAVLHLLCHSPLPHRSGRGRSWVQSGVVNRLVVPRRMQKRPPLAFIEPIQTPW